MQMVSGFGCAFCAVGGFPACVCSVVVLAASICSVGVFFAGSVCSIGCLFRPCLWPDCFGCLLERWEVFPIIHILPAFACCSVTFVDINETMQLRSDWCAGEI